MKYSASYLRELDNSWITIPESEKIDDKRIFITGATGLIGSSIADLLLRHNTISSANCKIILAGRDRGRTAKRFEIYTENVDYAFFQYDSTKVREYDIKADYIIYAASNADPISYVKTPVDIMLANLFGLQALLCTASKNPGVRVIYVSSSEVYGENVPAPYTEDCYGAVDILNPRACYPSSKRCAEALCVAYRLQYGVDSVIVRPGHIYGPMCTSTDSKASAQFARCAVEGKDIVMKSCGTQVRSYCYALDCASAILTVLIKGMTGEAYNISNSESLATVSELAHAFADFVGRKVIYENPSDVERAGYNMMTNSSLDSTKLESLGWRGLYSLKAGVEQTIFNM